jgi:hypothetical protein
MPHTSRHVTSAPQIPALSNYPRLLAGCLAVGCTTCASNKELASWQPGVLQAPVRVVVEAMEPVNSAFWYSYILI